MADWLHCNTCFRQPGDGCIFFLTGCGHIFCGKCQDKGWKDKCLLCGTCSPPALQLTSKLPSHVQMFFIDPVATLKKSSSNTGQIVQTLEWQNSHKKRYFKHLKDMITKEKCYVENLKKEFKNFIDQKEKDVQAYIQQLKKEFQHCMEEQKKQFHHALEEKIKEFRTHMQIIEKENLKLKEENSYLKRLLIEKSQAALLRSSPSGDRSRSSSSTTVKGFSGSPSSWLQQRSIQDRLHSQQSTVTTGYRVSPSSGTSLVCGRLAVKTPPASANRSGTYWTSPHQSYPTQTSHQSVPGIQERLHNLQRSQNRDYKTPPSTTIIPGRISVRTPPSGGRLGVIPSSPSPRVHRTTTPKSAPHPMGFDFETPPR